MGARLNRETYKHLPMNHIATAFWDNWNLSLPGLKNWNPPLPDPPDIIVLFVLSLVTLLFACYIFRMVTVGHWTEYRGAWVPTVIMISLFLIGFVGLAIIVAWTH